ncbi:MAG: PEP-CTERM sorting domain-containing protein [Acidobacteriota bacterium]|nr:PEP-CTERM sorting domain-containing protein [Acidobacteriota bacterium]
MKRQLSIMAIAAVAVLALAVGSAMAEGLTGSIGWGGAVVQLLDENGTQITDGNFANAYSIDFKPDQAHNSATITSSGDFSGLMFGFLGEGGTNGYWGGATFNDFTFRNEDGALELCTDFSESPLWIAYDSSGDVQFSFNLLTLDSLEDAGGSLGLHGTGYVYAWDNGAILYDTATLAFWDFSTQGSLASDYGYTWSANLGTVPEPGTIVLLGSGLLGAVALVRRRNRKAVKPEDKSSDK